MSSLLLVVDNGDSVTVELRDVSVADPPAVQRVVKNGEAVQLTAALFADSR